jgi:xanthine/uracil permease
MSFHDGLLWVTRSTITGWMTMSFFTVTPALVTAFFGSILIALYGDLQRQPDYAPAKWAQIVSFFYRNRMRR